MLDDEMQASAMDILSQLSQLKPTLSKKEAERFVEKCVSEHWLTNENGKISLGVRSLMELSTYLKNEYEEQFIYCLFCKEMCTNKVSFMYRYV